MQMSRLKVRLILTLLMLMITSLSFAATKNVHSSTTINYGDITLSSSGTVVATNWNEIWDLTKGDLTLHYTIDMTGVTQPSPWWTSYTEVGIRLEGASNFNPGTFNVYQGGCGGWMCSLFGNLAPSPGTQSLHDKHNLQCSGGRGEGDYDCTDPNTVVGPFGTTANYGIWFDRDTVDPWQATYWGSVNGGTYNTGGIYHVVISYHAINTGLGSMFATINGIQTGFWTAGWKNAQPEIYPAGLSFKGDMSRMQVFTGIWAGGAGYGNVVVKQLTVTGELGVSNPLTPDFTYNPPVVIMGNTIQFTDNTHGGSTPYAWWNWDFNNDGVTDSTLQNPTWQFTSSGNIDVKLTAKGHYGCETASITKTIHVYAEPPVGGEWIPIDHVGLIIRGLTTTAATIAVAASFVFARHWKKYHS